MTSAGVRTLDLHHDGHGLNESIAIEADQPDQSGASHQYQLWVNTPVEQGDPRDIARHGCGFVQFQKGPRNVEGSTAGATEAALLAVLIDRLRGFQAGPYPSRQNAIMLTKLEECLMWTKDRANERAKRGVLGTNAR